jgi:hypothetical protein
MHRYDVRAVLPAATPPPTVRADGWRDFLIGYGTAHAGLLAGGAVIAAAEAAPYGAALPMAFVVPAMWLIYGYLIPVIPFVSVLQGLAAQLVVRRARERGRASVGEAAVAASLTGMTPLWLLGAMVDESDPFVALSGALVSAAVSACLIHRRVSRRVHS